MPLPFFFLQTIRVCFQDENGLQCVGESNDGWPTIAAGTTFTKQCTDLVGYESRYCDNGGNYATVDNTGCFVAYCSIEPQLDMALQPLAFDSAIVKDRKSVV